MKTTGRFLIALLAVVVAGGCAGTGATVVQPLDRGQASAATVYRLRIAGQPAGRVALLQGRAQREAPRRSVVHVGLVVENGSQRLYRLSTDELYLTSASARAVPVLEVNQGAVPAALEIRPGETRTFDLAFVLPEPGRIADLGLFNVHWTLDVDGGQQPVVRSTAFAATGPVVVSSEREPQAVWLSSTRRYSGPGLRSPDRPITTQRTHTVPTPLGSGTP